MKGIFLTFFFVLTKMTTSQPLLGGDEKCLAIVPPHFRECSSRNRQPEGGTAKPFNEEEKEEECSTSRVCNKPFTFTYIEKHPFVHALQTIFSNALRTCCGKCKSLENYPSRTVHSQQFSRSLVNASSFVFPVLGYHNLNNMYGYRYVPILELSNGYFITRAQTPEQIVDRVMKSCASLWPLLLIMLLLAVVAGFLVWLTETCVGTDEFPTGFFVGLFDGFWWSFVSMTTVGYGDTSPKFFVSRLLSVVWILAGITICSMFTASLINEVTTVTETEHEPEMFGKTIGVLKYRVFDASFVAKLGGSIRETSGKSEVEDAFELKRMISQRGSEGPEVSGIFVDKYTYMFLLSVARFANRLNNTFNDIKSTARFFLQKTYKKKQSFEGDRMSYGIVVRDEEDFRFFSDFFRHNLVVHETCAQLELNEMDEYTTQQQKDMFMGGAPRYYPILNAILVGAILVGAILLVGGLVEIWRLTQRKVVPDAPVELGNTLGDEGREQLFDVHTERPEKTLR